MWCSISVNFGQVDPDSKRVSLGLKESYIGDRTDTKLSDDSDSEAQLGKEVPEGDSPNTHGPLEIRGRTSEVDVQMTLGGKDSKYAYQDDDDLQVLTASQNKESGMTFEAVPPLQVDLDLSESESDANEEDVEGSKNDLEMEHDQASVKENKRVKNRLKKKRFFLLA